MLVVNLVSPRGEKVAVKVSLLYFLNRNKVKVMLQEGYVLLGDADADLVCSLGIF